MFPSNLCLCGLIFLSFSGKSHCENPLIPILFPNSEGNFNIPGIKIVNTTEALEEDFESYEKDVHSLEKMEDFAKYFNFELPKQASVIDNFTISTRSGGITIATDDSPRNLPQATCEPELTTVPLDLPHENGKSYFPTCVRVNRCGGCCFLSHHSCQPISVETVYVKAMQIQEAALTRRNRRTRSTDVNVISVPVEKHNSCECRCRLQESECNPEIHSYNQYACACVCKDKAEQLKCLESKNHYWDDTECKCLCRQTLTCSTGQTFDHESCQCL